MKTLLVTILLAITLGGCSMWPGPTARQNLPAAGGAENSTSDDDRASSGQGLNVERGPYPRIFPGGRFTPHELKYFEAQERARKENPPTGGPRPVFPSSVEGP